MLQIVYHVYVWYICRCHRNMWFKFSQSTTSSVMSQREYLLQRRWEKEFNACLKYLNKQKRGWQNVETETKLGVCCKYCTQDCRTETCYPLGVINMTCSYNILLHCTFFLDKLFYARFKFLYTERQVFVEVQEITIHQI